MLRSPGTGSSCRAEWLNGIYPCGKFHHQHVRQLTTQDGQLVMGYPAVNGVISGPTQTLAPLQVDQGQLIPGPRPPPSRRKPIWMPICSGHELFHPLTVYDSLGNSHVLTYQFTKTAANAWSYQITLPAADTAGPGRPRSFERSTDLQRERHSGHARGAITGIAITGLADGASP